MSAMKDWQRSYCPICLLLLLLLGLFTSSLSAALIGHPFLSDWPYVLVFEEIERYKIPGNSGLASELGRLQEPLRYTYQDTTFPESHVKWPYLLTLFPIRSSKGVEAGASLSSEMDAQERVCGMRNPSEEAIQSMIALDSRYNDSLTRAKSELLQEEQSFSRPIDGETNTSIVSAPLFSAPQRIEVSSSEFPSTAYRLRVGDTLLISIYGEPSSSRYVTIDYTGRIHYLFIDPVFGLGKTIDELRREINEKVSKRIRFSLVEVTPISFGGRFYTILGEVNKPGKKSLVANSTLLRALAEAGGFRLGSFRSQTIELADLDHAFLARNNDYVPIDFRKLVIDGDMRQNISLEVGDYIYIPSALTREVYVVGEVNVPTTIGFRETVSFVEALSEARGVTKRASSRAVIIRGSLANPITYLVDFKRILLGLEPNLLLQPGDIIYVPAMKLTTMKEIVRAGVLSFVTTVASFAATTWFQNITPDATNISAPVNVIGQ